MNEIIFKTLQDTMRALTDLELFAADMDGCDLSRVDGGFRKNLPDFSTQYRMLIHTIRTGLSQATILHLQDAFLLHYVFFRIEQSGSRFYGIGPFLDTPDLKQDTFRNSLPCLDSARVLSAAQNILRNLNAPVQIKSVVQEPALAIPHHSEMTQQVMTYIHENLHNQLDLTTISDHIGFSETYISHLFRQETGISPMRYVLQQRITNAKELLINTDRPIQEIAASVGIPDCSYFTRIFRQYTGFTPSQYRKR